MNNRNTSVIATIVAAVLCGLPGLFGLCFGSTTLLAGYMPGARFQFFDAPDQASIVTVGILSFCLSVVLIAMPFVVWVVTRPKREPPPPSDDEPLPPTS